MQASRAMNAIYLKPLNIIHGCHEVMSFTIENIVTRNKQSMGKNHYISDYADYERCVGKSVQVFICSLPDNDGNYYYNYNNYYSHYPTSTDVISFSSNCSKSKRS
jgi:uncharacterized protein YycO